ncbi:MAG: hypothetical protein V8Q27_10000 [Eubacteriales bacterium]
MAEADYRRQAMRSWNSVPGALSPLAEEGILELPVVRPKAVVHNAHMFYVKAAIWRSGRD